MYEYPLWILLFAVLPVVALFIIKFKVLKKYKLIFLFTIIGSFIFSIPWDYIAIKEKIWYFAEPHIFGLWILGLPIEEYLFIIFETMLFTIITILLWKKFGSKK